MIGDFWIARNVELLDSNDNEILAMGYDDAGNTSTDSVDTVSLDDDVSITYSDGSLAAVGLPLI